MRLLDTGAGAGLACGTFDIKEDTRSCHKSSAKWFSLVLMYVGCNTNLRLASIKARHLNKCMIPGCLLKRERRHATTTWLSQWQVTRCPAQLCPHTAQAKTIGINSLHAMSRSLACSSHYNWSQCWPCHAPHPQEPEASVAISVEGRSSGGDRKATPFHEVMNSLHHARSDRNPRLRRIVAAHLRRACEPWRRSIMRLRNERPRRMTLHA